MSKLKQRIVLLVEPDAGWLTPSKIGKLFMNRFAIDEDASFEILKIVEIDIRNITDLGKGNPLIFRFYWSFRTTLPHDIYKRYSSSGYD